MIRFNIKQLEAFVAVAEERSFTIAAEKLYLTQPTISSHIRALEEALGTTLLKRESKRHVELTEEGRNIYSYAKTILEDCTRLQDDFDRKLSREILIGSSSLPAQQIVPDYVSGFMRENPQYICIVSDGDSDGVQKKILDGTVELGFVGSSDFRSALYYEKIAEDHLILAAPNTEYFRELKQRNTLGRELLKEPMITRETGSATQKLADNYLSGIMKGTSQLKVAARVSSMDVMRDMIANGAGTAILSEGSIRTQVRSGRILTFELEEKPVIRNIYFAYRKKGLLSDGARAFIQYVQERTGNQS